MIATEVTCPSEIEAIPIGITVVPVVSGSCTPTERFVWIPDLYPEPLLPIDTAVIVPAEDTVAVPPAATKGWYPNPSVDPTETITPPRGKSETPTSGPNGVVSVPWNLIEVIPAVSSSTYWSEIPGAWKTSFTRTIAFSFSIPEIFDPFDLIINSSFNALNSWEISSKHNSYNKFH